ncbi:EfeM/EfeO family lipoprotein [Amycolatopsis sp. PS_44_ISF1]|uniref:EfeM/EfeO family lipoprotein n=1 Tax=Amycolatopsis sp. PS_44_ISF1 TaxID=2974917 RepID=UPI0028DF79EF|nr:EfeM/EfeO family lipoprotein [Amycolatopsis sp. PS_44_ISF1]MDT8912647.1 EfeM/EfeO family lipoprotein [Amycolatopsis sp. PS_44_ISF1]
MRRSVGILGAAGFVAVVVGTTAGLPSIPPDTPVRAGPIGVSRSVCGDWTAPPPGTQTLQVRNNAAVAMEVEVIDPASGTVFGELDGVGPGTTRSLPVDLGDGGYALRCVPDDGTPFVGATVRVTGGAARPGPAVVPVTDADLLGPLKRYHVYVADGLGTLAGQTAVLDRSVHSGDREAARRDWLTAHLTYERLGAAYDAFGDSDRALNGTTDGRPGGARDPGFTGFHRLENGLWHDESLDRLAEVADRLDADVRDLAAAFADAQIGQNDLGLRAHEIMENTLQFELTGRTDYGSGSALATAGANLTGTRAVLDVLRPLLAPRFPGLPDLDAWIGRTGRDLGAVEGKPLAELTRRQRERVDADVSELTERLAPIAAITEPRRVS